VTKTSTNSCDYARFTKKAKTAANIGSFDALSLVFRLVGQFLPQKRKKKNTKKNYDICRSLLSCVLLSQPN
jgi:hypothetical protein